MFSSENVNPAVLESLWPTIVDPYCLDDRGCRLVFASNQELSESYYDNIDYPIDDYIASCYAQIYQAVPAGSRQRLLDVCCGTGRVAINVMMRSDFEQCVAIDINAIAVRRMREVARERGVGSIDPVVMNIMQTGFGNDSFDCVMGSSFLHHLPRNPEFLREMLRVLKPGGALCLTCEPSTSAPLLEDFFFRPLRRLRNLIRGAGPKGGGDVCMSDIWLYDKASLEVLLRDAGYGQVTIIPFGLLLTIMNKPLLMLCRALNGQNWMPHGLHRILSFLDRQLVRMLPPNMFSHFTVIARKV